MLNALCCNLVLWPGDLWRRKIHCTYHTPNGSYSRNDRTFGIMSKLSDNYATMYVHKIANSFHTSAKLFMVRGFFLRGDAFLCYMFMDTKTLWKRTHRALKSMQSAPALILSKTFEKSFLRFFFREELEKVLP